MDTSEQYIKMNEKAVEVQALRHYSCRPDSVNLPWWDTKGNCWFNQNNDKTIWLPRQDQLQEILLWDNDWLGKVGATVGDSRLFTTEQLFSQMVLGWYHRSSLLRPLTFFASYEQLWLAFVMREKYGKFWDGEDWGKPKDAPPS